jgi:hypothetical protein
MTTWQPLRVTVAEQYRALWLEASEDLYELLADNVYRMQNNRMTAI